MTQPAIAIPVDEAHVSGILQVPAQARACLVLAHGAGAGMTHAFMTAVADGLAARRIATLRFQFPAMEAGLKRPDRPAVAQATVRAAVERASTLAPGLPLFAGGKSFGGRMTSQAQAERPLPQVKGLVFFGFPLHPAGKPSRERAAHLVGVEIPMLFLQGTRDTLADQELVRSVVEQLGSRADMVLVEEADHSFHVPVRSGKKDPQIVADILDATAAWIDRLKSTSP